VKRNAGGSGAAVKPSGAAGIASPVVVGVGAAAGDIAQPVIGCDMTTGSDHCGDTECPKLPMTAPGTCGVVGCCSSAGKCGYRSAATLNGAPASMLCMEVAVPDARCRPVSFGLSTLPGCCDATGMCGQLLGTTCGPVANAVPCEPSKSGGDGGI
jgi:hypothetical protein